MIEEVGLGKCKLGTIGQVGREGTWSGYPAGQLRLGERGRERVGRRGCRKLRRRHRTRSQRHQLVRQLEQHKQQLFSTIAEV